MIERESKRVQNIKGLFTLLRIVVGGTISGTTPDGDHMIFTEDALFITVKPGLTKISHEKAFADDLITKALLSCEWGPAPGCMWRPSPLIHLAFEAPDGEEAQACLQVDHGSDGVVHAPEADEVLPPSGLSL